MFEGQKAVFALFTDLIKDAKAKELYLTFALEEENKNEQTNLFFKNLALRRREKKLDVRLLKNIKYYKKEKHTKLKMKYTDFNLTQGITIFRNYLILWLCNYGVWCNGSIYALGAYSPGSNPGTPNVPPVGG